ncbi:GH32 C-terminal domain-containing protein [Clostridium oryzae]|uniref:beta-fructofuranosidase n=1 Tax=Clostridium oryzae TaxID=1450648 RepID=A0A1V4IL05_9CLOT|nr:GH32 C-terminal domain-containing protein [Clostridium oryzae]OPJ60583.1 sucrose-6-phosphate hydrolase [Clostridium oryzae]
MAVIDLKFEMYENENLVTLDGLDLKDRFTINNGEKFPNRYLKFSDNNAFLFDGYSTWFNGNVNSLYCLKDFTISILLAPMSFETAKSGIISKFDYIKKLGFYIAIRKLGFVSFGFGDGKEIYECESINYQIINRKWNLLTVVFNSSAGWCDLYVNGKMSNRKQFPRHTIIKYGENKCFVGKYIDYNKNFEDNKAGVFNGYIESIKIIDTALYSNEVLKEYNWYFLNGEIIGDYLDRNNYVNDNQRPKYHLIAPGKWMNEPHGPLYYAGYYHIFYQANPHAPLWDNIQWGHMISKDMVHWEALKLALETENNNLDPDGCWSGSSCIDKSGLPTIFYTAGNNNKFPNQGIGMARADISVSAKLEKWNKKEKLIVEQTENDGWIGEFRDPFVWLQDNVYYMLVGTGDNKNGGGNALVYSSQDLTHWVNHGFLMDYDYKLNEEVGHVWELPVLLPIKNEEGKAIHHILLICACQVENSNVETYYWTGDWDCINKKFIKYHEKAKLIDLGNGTFTGPSGFVTPDGRSVVFTIAQGKRNFEEEFNSGWAHNGGLPIELFSKNSELCIKPIKEIYTLKQNRILDKKNISIKELNELLKDITSNMLYVKITANLDYIGLSTMYDDDSLEVFYDRGNSIFAAKRGSDSSIISKMRGDIDKVDIKDNTVEIEYFLDHSMIEVYLNNLKSITLRNYTKDNSRKLKLIGNENDILISIELWTLKSVY